MTKRKTLRWHQAFYASLKIELQEDTDCLEFLREHVIGSEPVRADLLVIKKKDDRVLQKRIGRMFRTYNVVEYKSPEDYLSVDDFYKGCAYVGLYKALTGSADQIKITEMTLTLACFHYPGKLLRHLKDVRGFQIREEDAGILRIIGTFVPIQILVTKELTKEENRWISSLSNRLEEGEQLANLLKEYETHKSDPLYRVAMDVIVRANWRKVKEVQSEMAVVCDALMELMEDELKQEYDKGFMDGIKAFVRGSHKLRASQNDTIAQLIEQYSMEEEEARKAVEEYWNS